MKYPNMCKTKKSKIGYWLLWQEYLLGLGRGVVGRFAFTSVIVEFMAIFWFLEKLFKFKVTPTNIVLFMVFLFTANYFVGYFWQKNHLDRLTILVQAQRNPLMKDIHDTIVKGKGETI